MHRTMQVGSSLAGTSQPAWLGEQLNAVRLLHLPAENRHVKSIVRTACAEESSTDPHHFYYKETPKCTPGTRALAGWELHRQCACLTEPPCRDDMCAGRHSSSPLLHCACSEHAAPGCVGPQVAHSCVRAGAVHMMRRCWAGVCMKGTLAGHTLPPRSVCPATAAAGGPVSLCHQIARRLHSKDGPWLRHGQCQNHRFF